MACFGGGIDAARREYRVLITETEQHPHLPRCVDILLYGFALLVFGLGLLVPVVPVMYVVSSLERGHWLSRQEFAHLKHHGDADDENGDGGENGDDTGPSAQHAVDAAVYEVVVAEPTLP